LTLKAIEEIGIATLKCSKIKKIDGNPAKITELYLSGKNKIEQVKIGYLSNNQIEYQTYSLDNFYKIKE
jgi:hypothetical protein